MAIEFNLSEDLHATEVAIVDWKRRSKEYEQAGLAVPRHIVQRIEMLRRDARLLRAQIARNANEQTGADDGEVRGR